MDTLELALHDPALPNRLLNRLRDCGPSRRYRDKEGKVQNQRYGYRKQYYVEPDGKSFYLAFDPWHGDYAIALVQIHLSQFPTFYDAVIWLKAIMGEDFGLLHSAEVKRLDLCIDLSLPYETVLQTITQPRGRSHDRYRSNQGESHYLGKQPRQTCIYRKQLSIHALDDVASYSDSAFITGTRIEVRHTKTKLPIKTLGDLVKLRRFNPFEHLRLCRLDEAVIASLDGEIPIHVKAYQYDVAKYGAQAARKKHNKSRNFAKTIGRYLGPVELDLAEAWQRRLDRFLGPPNEGMAMNWGTQ